MTTENIPTIGSTRYVQSTLSSSIIDAVIIKNVDVAELRNTSIK